MEAKYLTIDEAAERFKVKPRTIRHWMTTRDMPYVKIGGLIRFEEYRLDQWVKEQNEK